MNDEEAKGNEAHSANHRHHGLSGVRSEGPTTLGVGASQGETMSYHHATLRQQLRADACFQALWDDYLYGSLRLHEFIAVARDMALELGDDDETALAGADDLSVPFCSRDISNSPRLS